MIFDRPVVLGATGQLGRAYQELFTLLGVTAKILDRTSLDLEQVNTIESRLAWLEPTVVINAAAYTDVPGAEKDEARANIINGIACGVLAKFCGQNHIPYVGYSTDYVFGDSGEISLGEDHEVNPLNAYGRSKLLGENETKQNGKNFLVFRTSWVYDANGKNFLNTMLKLGREREELSVVNDQFGSPTYAFDIAWGTYEALKSLLEEKKFPSGIYHMVNSGFVSWYDFANTIFKLSVDKGANFKVKKVMPISTEAFGGVVKRPLNSRLSTSKFEKTFGVKLRSWEQALKVCLEKKFIENN